MWAAAKWQSYAAARDVPDGSAALRPPTAGKEAISSNRSQSGLSSRRSQQKTVHPHQNSR